MTRQCHRQHDSMSISCRDQVSSVTPSQAWLDNITMPWPTSPCQHYHQHDSELTSCHGQVALSPAWLGMYIMLQPSRRGIVTANIGSAAPSPAWLGDLMRTFPMSNLTQRFTTRALGLKKCHSKRRSNSDTLLPTSLTLTWGERVITTMLSDTSLNQLSHLLSYIFFRVNASISIYCRLVNILF
jgi:hypothetical protein